MVVESVEPGCLFTMFFYVTGARKDDKNRQTDKARFSLLKKG